MSRPAHLRSAMLLITFATCLCFASVSDVVAQGREERRKVIGDLLKSLIESQLDRQARPNNPAPSRPADPRLARVRVPLKQFSQESARLVQHLNTHDATSHRLRPLLNDALRVQSSVAVLEQQMQRGVTYDQVVESFRPIDRDMRLLSYRLGEVPGLDPACVQCVKQLDAHGRSLCEIMSIAPQVDYAQLATLCSACAREVDDLIEDLEIELGATPQCRQLVASGRRVDTQLRYLARSVARRADYETLVAEYKRVQQLWSPYAVEMRRLNNRFLERGVRRIDEVKYNMQDLLLLPHGVDYALLAHEVQLFHQDLERLFAQVTLQQVLRLRDPQVMISVSDEFHGLLEYLASSVADRDVKGKLMDDFGYLEEAWPPFRQSYEQFRQPEVAKALQRLEASFVTLQQSLGVRPEFDRTQATQLAATIENLAEHLRSDYQQYLRVHPAYRQDFKVKCGKHIDAFHKAASHLSGGFVERASTAHLHRDCRELNTAWNAVNEQFIKQLRPQERYRLSRLTNEITKANVGLQTLLLE